MKQIWNKLIRSPKTIFWLGVVLVVLITGIEFLHHGAENYTDFRDATRNFWSGISSYTPEYVSAHGRFYIYTPVFNVLFTPFAYLPFHLGGLLWNLLGWGLFYLAMTLLPGYKQSLAPMLWYLLLVVMQSVFPFQFNLLVCDIFLLAYALLERDKGFWAVALIMVSATCKVYGAIELALLLCYPRFWRNIGYAALWGAGLLLVPAVRLESDLGQWYMDWMNQLTVHTNTTCEYYSLIWAQPIQSWALPYMRWFQMGVLLVLAACFFACYRSWQKREFRIGVLATLMIYIVLMSEAAEFTTHTISMTGYALWLFYRMEQVGGYKQLPTVDRVLMWLLFVLFGILPIDIFCPSKVCMFVHTTLWLGVWVFTVAWIRVVYTTVVPCLKK